MRPRGDLHFTDSSAPAGGAPLAGGLRAYLEELLKIEIVAPEGERTQFVGRWVVGRSVTIATELI